MSTIISQTDHQSDQTGADGLPFDVDRDADLHGDGSQEQVREPVAPVVVRRNAGFAALVGAAASAIAIAYLWRATQSAAPLDWALCGVMAAIGTIYLAHFVDSRTPLLVADDLGVRIRLGRQWRGLPWDAVEAVVVTTRRGPLKDGRLVFAPHSIERALDGLDGRGRRAAAMNQKMYGAALAVPLGLTTRVSTPGPELAGRLAALSEERAAVVEATPEPEVDQPDDEQVERQPEQAAEPEVEQVDLTPEEIEPQPFEPQPFEPVYDLDEPEAFESELEPADEATPAPRRSLAPGLATFVSRVARGRRKDLDAPSAPEGAEPEAEWDEWEAQPDVEPGVEPDAEPDAGPDDLDATPEPTDPQASGEPAVPEQPTARSRSALPLRMRRRGSRTDAPVEAPAAGAGIAALAADHDEAVRPQLPESAVLRRTEDDGLAGDAHSPHDDRVRPIARLGDPVEPLVIDDVTEPANDPVIGPELAAARTRVGLSVDELAERTRIRPHVIESIEVDDFVPCGGDFYARGHLRTLARVLGRDPEPLLAMFDNRYATAPINARRVFEAEMATGANHRVRHNVGSPNWALLIGVVLVLVLVWGVIRLFASEPSEVLQPSTPVLNGSAGVEQGPASKPQHGAVPAVAPKPMHVTLVGAQDGSQVVVRDRTGKVVWAGEVVLGEKRVVPALPPVKVQATVGGAIETYVKGRDRGPVGTTGQPGVLTLTRLPG